MTGLVTVCTGHLSVLSLYQEIDETIKHTEDFKHEAVRVALSSGLSLMRIAADLGIGKSILAKWIVDYRLSELVSGPQADLAHENNRIPLKIGFYGR